MVHDAVDHRGRDDLVAEYVAPTNWSWHMFVVADFSC